MIIKALIGCTLQGCLRERTTLLSKPKTGDYISPRRHETYGSEYVFRCR